MNKNTRWFRAVLCGLVAFLSSASLSAQLYMRVIDVGQGLCIVVKETDPSGPHYLIYDAGAGSTWAMKGIHDVIPKGSNIDLMVISHNDSDHLGAVPNIMEDYHVKKIIHPGDERDTITWRKSRDAIRDEIVDDDCVNLDLAKKAIPSGTSFTLGNLMATFVAGFSRPPSTWDIEDPAEDNNAGSVIVRLTYEGKSILLCGDAVGRHRDSPPNTCIDSEKNIVDNARNVPIKSDVLVAPHHGGNNGSSELFIDEVSPTYVIFSAGHSSNYRHPSKDAAMRYITAGIKTSNMFRTDLGDDEGPKEWAEGRIAGNHDPSGDDDVDVKVSETGALTVGYRTHP